MYVKSGEPVVVQDVFPTVEPTVKTSDTTPPLAKPFLSAIARTKDTPSLTSSWVVNDPF